MASLNKLAIRGIRSFDDKGVQVIEFYSPLTVIVGHNGSGKTTIIECLKYATTGDMPPNTKGGAFIHDPKMANEKEVKAQVRLRFWNVNRQRMTATRNLQVTMKKTGALTMKTLEGILAKTDIDSAAEGKRNTISTKCSEMDEEVPLLLGVSKAILENVIFCHQEESNWPLAEPAALKKKFDDIFEATKYTKALDNIKTLRKERTAELKVDKERLKFMKADKDKAERARLAHLTMKKDIADLEAKHAHKEARAQQLKDELENLKAINVTHYAEATGFQRIFEQFETLKQRKSMLEENRRAMADGMNVMSESTEELNHMLSNFAAHVSAIEAKKAKQLELRDKEDAAIDDLRRRERNLASTQGGLTANKRAYERNVKERESAIREVAKSHNFAGYDYSPLEEDKIVEFMDTMHELLRKSEADLKRLQADGARKERELQAELDRLAGAKTSAIATKKSKQDQIVKLNEKIRASESSFDSVSSYDVEIEMLEARIAEYEEQRTKLEADVQAAKYDDQIRDKVAAIRQKEADRDKVNGELSALNRQADSRAQLSIKRGELSSKESQIAASVSSHASRFKELVEADLDAETMEEKITFAVGKKDRELQEAEASASASNRTLSQLQTSINIAKQSLKKSQDEQSRLQRTIDEALAEVDKTSIQLAIDEAVEEVEYRQNSLTNSESQASFWQSMLHVGKSQHKCNGCDRALGASDMKQFEKYVKSQIDRLSSDQGKKEIQEELEQWRTELEKFRGLLPAEVNLVDLREKTIPGLEKQIADEGKQIDRAQEEVEEAKLRLQRSKIAARDLQTLKSAAVLVTRTLGDIKDLRSDVARLERDLQSTGLLKTVEDVQREVDAITNEIKNLQRDQASLSSEKELKLNNLRSSSDDFGRKTLRLGQLKGLQEKRQREEAALAELHENLAALQAELKDLDAAAQAAEAPWREQNDSLNRYRSERTNAENDASLQVGTYQSSLNEVEAKHKACQAYLLEGNDRKIRETEAQIEEVKREIAASTEARAAIDAVISALQTDIAKSDALKNNISNNLRYRSSEKEIDKVQEEIDGIDIEGAAKSRKEFNTVYKNNLEQETEIQGQWQLARGELAQMTENLNRTKATLDTDYKDIQEKYKVQLIKTKVSEVANNDLEKYGKALDNAILKYHSIKMDEINDSIGHLWNKTYQGTDIDGIRIVSDHDETTSTSTRKSYNYRVVMVKNDVELDMRGRCSAGQKVLASIIIRLALAESFGQGCGVLALDEPTTNLDQENINALAEALAEIIRERRRQANFQLIVITHDEGFLQRLAAHDVLEYYWRVSRDANQKSTLERQRVGV